MSTEKFLNVISQYASMANSGRFVTTGVVSAYDPNNHLVQVQTDAAGDDYGAITTGWIPWVTPALGVYAPPPIGSICTVHYREGSSQVPYAQGCFYGNNNVPQSVPSGEVWFVNANGSFVKIANDGKVLINGNVEIDLTAPTLNITVTGTCNIKANQVNLGDTSGDLLNLINVNFKDTFNEHTHGGGPPPDEPMPPDNATVNVRAT
jgi:phage baseplate assembly protein gpV